MSGGKVIVKDNIKEIVSAEIGSRATELADINITNMTKKIEKCFLNKYGIDIGKMLGNKSYKINTAGELKFAIDDALEITSGIREMKAYLRDNYKIEVKLGDKEILFKHPQELKYIGGNVLGKEYSGAGIYRSFLEKRRKDNTGKKRSVIKSRPVSMER